MLEEKQQFYRIIGLRVVTNRDGPPVVSGVFGEGFGVFQWRSQRRVIYA